nr:MAG TPA: hypothetical protein [Caudoviricetes sp.]
MANATVKSKNQYSITIDISNAVVFVLQAMAEKRNG